MYLNAAETVYNAPPLRDGSPNVWRWVRRFNEPVQMALAAAQKVSTRLVDPQNAGLLSMAPCRSGSPELYDWSQQIIDRAPKTGPLRVNPIHTLHAVDNLALSVLAIELGSTGFGYGFGGAAGQIWQALELALERLDDGLDAEILILAGDQDSSKNVGPASGAAVALSSRPTRLEKTHRTVRISGLDHTTRPHCDVIPHAANGLIGLIAFIEGLDIQQRATYRVPASDGDGLDQVVITVEVS